MAAGDVPLRWSETENMLWKAPIPGKGHSTPVIWGDRMFLTTAVPTSPGGGMGDEHEFVVMALDKRTGKVLWKQVARAAKPHEGYHRKYGSYASNSPVTDGERVYAFVGSRGIYCYTLDGELVWKKDPGIVMRTRLEFGEGAAPALEDGFLLVNYDHEGDDYLLALDKLTGEERWRVSRDEPSSWSQPVVAEHGGSKQVIVAATNRTRAYDLETGRQIWEAGGLGSNVIPVPVWADGIVYVMSGHRQPNLLAIRLGGEGDLTGTDEILWTNQRGNSYTASPVLHDGRLYMITDSGMLSCLDARTGEPHYLQQRLPNPYNFKASPVGVNGKLYLATEQGDVVVVRMGETYEVLAVNRHPGEEFIASPVVSEGRLYLRGQSTVYAIGAQ
jgi:outer membrane protein assembly factor BamB